MSMRALMIVPQAFYSTRGTPLSAYHRARELILRGHQVDILTYPVGGEPPDIDSRIYRSRGPHFASTIKAGPSKLKIWFDLLLFLNLIVLLIRKRYDFIYTHEEAAFMIALLKPIIRKPFIYDMHSSLPLQITEWDFSSSKLVIKFFHWIERVSVKNATAVVAISPAVEKAAKEAWASTPTVVIVNHFETPATAEVACGAKVRQEFGVQDKTPLVVYTGSFVALQALDLLIDAVPHVLKRVPDTRFLLVGGTGTELDAVNRCAEAAGVADSIIIIESRPQSEMQDFMAAADVLVSPRIRGINPPGKLFSYLASGKPVVATDCLVHNQLIDNSCAVLTDPTSESFADGITRALTDPDLVHRLADGAERFLEQYCSAASRDAAYQQLIRYMSAEHSKRSA